MNSKIEVDKICNALFEDFVKLLEAKNAENLLSFFHPHAVLIQVGQNAVYGRDALLKIMEQWCGMDAKIEYYPTKHLSTNDGEFLIDNGQMNFKFDDGNVWKCDYEFIYKREDGKYLLLSDSINPLDTA